MKRSLTKLRFEWSIVLLATLVAAMLPSAANAFNFKPTPTEWAMWPDYCKARYVSLPMARQSPYRATVPPAAIESWKARLGNTTFTHVHHYCASLAYMQRASAAQSSQERNHLLRSAEGECNYTLQRIPPNSPIYRDVAAHMQYVKTVRGPSAYKPN